MSNNRKKNHQQNKKFVHQLIDIDSSNNQISDQEQDFIRMLEIADTAHIKEDTVVKGQVISVDKNVVIVDVGLKNEGRISVSEFLNVETDKLPEVGDFVDVFVDKSDGRKGTVLSRTKAIREESWEKLELLFAKGENVDGIIFDRVKGGFTVNIQGVIAFLPGSQVDIRPIKDISSIMNIVQPFQIVKIDKIFGNIVVSRKAVLEELRAGARDKVLSNITEGTILTGSVKNITNYGAFIDLGEIDGLLHVTDISWRRISHPSEVLHFGQEVRVVVINYDPKMKRISLGMKQLDTNPWDNVIEEFPVNKIMNGKVTNITDYGVFVELKEGVEGLIHSSEINWGKNTSNPRRAFFIGQEIEFVVLEIDAQNRRISLSMKRCTDNPIIQFAANHPVGSIIKAPIRNITDFGMFVSIGESTDGMIHESEISWDGNGHELLKNFNKGDEVECQVISIDIERERVALGIKQLTPNPHLQEETKSDIDTFSKNMIVTCTISKKRDDGLEVLVEGKVEGFIKKSNLAYEKYDQKLERFSEGERIDAKILSVDKETKIIELSIKAFEKDERDKIIKEYGSTDSGASLGNILGVAFDEHKNKIKLEKDNTDDTAVKDED